MYSRLTSPRISLGANIEYTNSYYRISNNYMIYIHYKILYWSKTSVRRRILITEDYISIKLQKIIYLLYSI